jgi:methylglyoxal synthase
MPTGGVAEQYLRPSGRQARDESAGVAAELVRYCDQLVPQSGDHDVVVADTHASARHVLTMIYPVNVEIHREELTAYPRIRRVVQIPYSFDRSESPRIVTKQEALAMRCRSVG